jgi:hypothetical protein
MLSHAGIINRIEDTQVMQSVDINSQKRMDITADNFLPGTSLNIDVSVTDPRQICLATAIPGKAADTREKQKIAHYGQIYKEAGQIFSPFVLESFGRWGVLARKTFKNIMDHMELHGSQAFFHLPKSRIAHYWRAKITMAMHRQACIGIHRRISSVIQSRQGIKNQKNLAIPVVEKNDPCAVLCALESCG